MSAVSRMATSAPPTRSRISPSASLIAAGLPVSAKLGLSAIFLALVFGIGLGVTAALYQNRMSDHAIMSIAMFGITIPNFVTAPLLTLLFGVYGLHVFGIDISLPVAGWNGGALRNMVLPVTVLALPQIAIIARLVRGSMVEVLHSNYCAHRARQRHAELRHRHAARVARGAAAAGQLSRPRDGAARHRR